MTDCKNFVYNNSMSMRLPINKNYYILENKKKNKVDFLRNHKIEIIIDRHVQKGKIKPHKTKCEQNFCFDTQC